MDYEVCYVNQREVSFRILGEGRRKILFFHGIPGSSQQVRFFAPTYLEHDVSIMCFDRPGYNETKIHSDCQITDTMTIAKGLTENQGWESVSLVGVSGGTTGALNFARRFPEMVKDVTIICGVGPLHERSLLSTVKRRPYVGLSLLAKLPTPVLNRAIDYLVKKDLIVKFVSRFQPASEADQRVLASDPEIREKLGIMEACTQGFLGPQRDAQALFENWHWPLAELKVPVHFWHGEEDGFFTTDMATRMQQQVPGAQVDIVSGEGHYSLPISCVDQILTTVASR